MSSVVEKIRRFHNALDLAIKDRELEERGELLHYFYDADVVLGTVNGLETEDLGQIPDLSDLKYAVRALLSTGYLPPIRLLSPHLGEFDSVLRRLRQPRQRSYVEMLRMLIALGVDERDAVLRRRIETPDGLFEFLQDRGFRVFVALELCFGGAWKARLTRLVNTGLLRIDPTELPNPNDPKVAEFAQMLSEVRDDPRWQLNNYYDAVALAELMRKMDRSIDARFYTETRAVRHVVSRLGLVSYSRLPVDRTEEYFLLRSSFPAVGFLNVAQRISAASPFSLDVLRELSHHLGTVLAEMVSFTPPFRATADLNHALHAEGPGGMGIGELVERFYNLGFLNSVFLSWTPRQMEQWLPSLSRATSDSSVITSVRHRLKSSLNHMHKMLNQEMGQLREWQEDHHRILKASEERARAFTGQFPSLDVDLGFGQWGIPKLLPQIAERLEARLASLMDRDERVMHASDLALSLAKRAPDTAELSLQVCLLWFLNLNELVIRTFSRAEVTKSERSAIPSWLRVFKILALARMAYLEEELSEIVLQAEADAAAADDQTRGYALGALAHVCFRAWHLAGLNDKGAAIDWAHRSFEAARQAVSSLELGSLEWAFAVNQCAYIGIETRVYPEETAQCVAMLIEQVPRAFYHHRFVDTIVWASTTQVILEIETHGLAALSNVPDLAVLRRQLCMTLISGRTQLRENRTVTDEELIQHLTQIEYYLTMLRCEFVTGPGIDLH